MLHRNPQLTAPQITCHTVLSQSSGRRRISVSAEDQLIFCVLGSFQGSDYRGKPPAGGKHPGNVTWAVDVRPVEKSVCTHGSLREALERCDGDALDDLLKTGTLKHHGNCSFLARYRPIRMRLRTRFMFLEEENDPNHSSSVCEVCFYQSELVFPYTYCQYHKSKLALPLMFDFCQHRQWGHGDDQSEREREREPEVCSFGEVLLFL